MEHTYKLYIVWLLLRHVLVMRLLNPECSLSVFHIGSQIIHMIQKAPSSTAGRCNFEPSFEQSKCFGAHHKHCCSVTLNAR